MNTTTSSLTEQSMANNISGTKKRTADDLKAAEQPQNPSKRSKTSEKGTLATGFLVDGTWVEDVKFACLLCRRGHRTNKCEHTKEGRPVGPVPEVGRPAVGEKKSPQDPCQKSQQCICRHISYMLELIRVNDQDKWKIQKAVTTNARCEIVAVDDPVPARLGQFWDPSQPSQ